MLAKPKEQQPDMELDEGADLDIETGRGMLGSLILAPEGEQAVVKALSSSNPPKMLAMFLVQGIEMIQRRSMQTDTPLDARIWLSGGGVVDEIMVDIAEIAADNNIPFPIAQMLPAIKESLVPLLKQRGQQLQSEGQEPAAPQGGGMAAPQGGM